MNENEIQLFDYLIENYWNELLVAEDNRDPVVGRATSRYIWEIKRDPRLMNSALRVVTEAIEYVKKTKNYSFLSPKNKQDMQHKEPQLPDYLTQEVVNDALSRQYGNRLVSAGTHLSEEQRQAAQLEAGDYMYIPRGNKSTQYFNGLEADDGFEDLVGQVSANLPAEAVNQLRGSSAYREFDPEKIKNVTVPSYKRVPGTDFVKKGANVPIQISPEMRNLVNIVGSNRVPKYYDRAITKETAEPWLAKTRPGWEFQELDITGPGGRPDGIKEAVITDRQGNIKIVNGYGIGMSDGGLRAAYLSEYPKKTYPYSKYKRAIKAIDSAPDPQTGMIQYISDYGEDHRSASVSPRRYFAEFIFKPAYDFYYGLSDFNPGNPYIGRLKSQSYNSVLSNVLYGYFASMYIEKNPNWSFFELTEKEQNKWKKANKAALSVALPRLFNAADKKGMIAIFRKIMHKLTEYWVYQTQTDLMGEGDVPYNAYGLTEQAEWEAAFNLAYAKVMEFHNMGDDGQKKMLHYTTTLDDNSLGAQLQYLDDIQSFHPSQAKIQRLTELKEIKEAEEDIKAKIKQERQQFKQTHKLKKGLAPAGYSGFFAGAPPPVTQPAQQGAQSQTTGGGLKLGGHALGKKQQPPQTQLPASALSENATPNQSPVGKPAKPKFQIPTLGANNL